MKRLLRRADPPGDLASAKESLEHASGHVDKRVSTLEERLAKCEEELKNVSSQIQSTRGPGCQQALKQKALAILKRKKMYESQRDGLIGTQLNIDQAQFAADQLETTALTVDAMKTASQQLKHEYKKIDLTKLERVQDDMADLLFDQQEVTDILSRNYALPDDIDDAELEAEFAALAGDANLESAVQAGSTVPDYLPSAFPSVPSGPVGESSQIAGSEDWLGMRQ